MRLTDDYKQLIKKIGNLLKQGRQQAIQSVQTYRHIRQKYYLEIKYV